MNLNLIYTFNVVASVGSLTKAAKLLQHPKSKVSRDLVKLENDLELTLLIRSSRGIILTEEGEKLLAMTQLPLRKIKNSFAEMQSQHENVSGRVRVTAPEDLSIDILTQVILDFNEAYPYINIELFTSDAFIDFNKNEIDLAVRIGRLQDSNLVQKKVCEMNVIFVASNKYVKSSPKITSTDDLYDHNVSLLKDTYGQTINSDFKKVKTYFSSNSIPVLYKFAKSARGIATIPEYLCREDLSKKELVNVLPERYYLKRSMYILSRHSNFTLMHVKIFKNYLYEQLCLRLKIDLS